MNKIQTICNKH